MWDMGWEMSVLGNVQLTNSNLDTIIVCTINVWPMRRFRYVKKYYPEC
jgi:hypothetical protein